MQEKVDKVPVRISQVDSLSSIGAKRIARELLEDPKAAAEHIKKWDALVSSIAGIVRADIAGLEGKAQEEAFIKSVAGVVYSNLGIKYGHFGDKHELYTSLDSGLFDCDNSAFLFYDVANQLGIETQMVFTRQPTFTHIFLKTNHFAFETTEPSYFLFFGPNYFDISDLSARYPAHRIIETSEMRFLLYCFYLPPVIYPEEDTSYNRDVTELTKLIAASPDDPFLYVLRSGAYSALGMLPEATRDYEKSNELFDALGKNRQLEQRRISQLAKLIPLSEPSVDLFLLRRDPEQEVQYKGLSASLRFLAPEQVRISDFMLKSGIITTIVPGSYTFTRTIAAKPQTMTGLKALIGVPLSLFDNDGFEIARLIFGSAYGRYMYAESMITTLDFGVDAAARWPIIDQETAKVYLFGHGEARIGNFKTEFGADKNDGLREAFEKLRVGETLTVGFSASFSIFDLVFNQALGYTLTNYGHGPNARAMFEKSVGNIRLSLEGSFLDLAPYGRNPPYKGGSLYLLSAHVGF